MSQGHETGAVFDEPEPIGPNFTDLSDYLDTRPQIPNFLMIEFGHGVFPLAARQRQFFSGDRNYKGVEVWERGHAAEQVRHIDRLAKRLVKKGCKVSFIHHHLKGRFIESYDDPDVTGHFEGEYNTETELANGQANEVLFSNVFGDEMVAYQAVASEELLREAARVVRDDGVIVIRETFTPERTRVQHGRDKLERLGFKTLDRLYHLAKYDDLWARLEATYSGRLDKRDVSKQSFYLFLANH